MERLILDKIDLIILATLTRDCRASYSSIGSLIGLTSRSVKARVKNMVRNRLIERFIVRVNPAAFGYRTAHILLRTNKGQLKTISSSWLVNLEILPIMYIIWEELLWLPLSSIDH